MNNSTIAKVPVVITVDLDGDLPLLNADASNINRQKARSVGTYGLTEGAPRLLRLFESLGQTATWFIPGQIAMQHPELVSQIHATGHEIGVHGHDHADFDDLDLGEQERQMIHGAKAIERVTGEPSVGFRVPDGEWKPLFTQKMAEHGFTWSSSLPSDDRPFKLGDSGLVEVPFRYELEDLQYMAFNLEPEFPPGQSRIASHRTVFENWAIEWQAAKKFKTSLVLRLNAEVIGTPGRILKLQKFLESVRNDEAAEFMTCGQLAKAYRTNELLEKEHPYALWEQLMPKEKAKIT